MTDDYNPLINADRYKSRIDMSVIGPMKKFDPLPIPFQSVPIKSVPIETESEKNRDPIDRHRHRCDPIFGRLP